MKDRYENGDLATKPNVITVTSFLNCCAHTLTRRDRKASDEVVRIALLAFNLLLEKPDYGGVNSIAFRTLLEVFGQHILTMPSRNRYASKIFQLCVKEGMVDDKVLRILRRYTPDLYKELPSDRPISWSRNIQ